MYSEELTMDLFTGLLKPEIIEDIQHIDIYWVRDGGRWYREEALEKKGTSRLRLSDRQSIMSIVKNLRYTEPGIKDRNLKFSEPELHLLFIMKNETKAYLRASWDKNVLYGIWSVNLYAPIAYQINAPKELIKLIDVEFDLK